ncbi:hypothetical protein RKD47_006714 [Streptomyces albogriseolus]
MTESESSTGPLPPYGPPIHDAIVSGDLQHMKAVAEAARKALYEVEFQPVAADQREEVKEALEALESAITRLDNASGTSE